MCHEAIKKLIMALFYGPRCTVARSKVTFNVNNNKVVFFADERVLIVLMELLRK